MEEVNDIFGTKENIDSPLGSLTIYNINNLKDAGFENISQLPYSLKILLENLLRNLDGKVVMEEHVKTFSQWYPDSFTSKEIPFKPSRIILQDFTGVPTVVDLAALRSAALRSGGEPNQINPQIPVDLVIDHSVQVDYFGNQDARWQNEKLEYERNSERYTLLHWAQSAFSQFRVVPPGRGIVHQVNLEYLAKVVHFTEKNGENIAIPDTLLGTDSHTTMINALGVLGWGVGGIEAESVMLGQPYYIPIPEVVGFRLFGKLKDDVFATDLVLTITEILRKHNVVGKFVEFFGPGLKNLSLPDRATIANMAPEYGATMGFFPVDEETLNYLLLTGKGKDHVDFVRGYCKVQGLFYHEENVIEYKKVLELDMGTIRPSLAGPKRPQDRIPLGKLEGSLHEVLKTQGSLKDHLDQDFNRFLDEGGSQGTQPSVKIPENESKQKENLIITHGSVVIAAITSCTNTSNPKVMLGAGLLAKAAMEKGLKVKPWVRTSLAPGSKVVTEYLHAAGLDKFLESLGFYLVGYGCTTCIGNSGPLSSEIAKEIKEKDLTVASVLSGNRNFEGRIHQLVRANYLASPPLVVAYALAGTVDIDLENEPMGFDKDNNEVYLRDIWPDKKEINELSKNLVKSKMFKTQYSDIFKGNNLWNDLDIPAGNLFLWDEDSTYIREPPFFMDFPVQTLDMNDIQNARVLALLGDSITTDHISPAGAISEEGPAGQFLISKGITHNEFNSFGSRRGNHEVMMRGTFGNIRLKNKLVPEREGGWTRYIPTGEEMTIFEAAMQYIKSGIPSIVIAGKEYGTGSSRDWAAKGTYLLGVKAVLAESYERIHRSNLVGMGVLPLQFEEGMGAEKLQLKGDETYDILGIKEIVPNGKLKVIVKDEKEKTSLNVITRLDSDTEIEYFRNGGILHKFLRDTIVKK